MPVYKNRKLIAEYLKEIVIGIVIDGTTAMLSAYWIAKLLGASGMVLKSIAPKSVTTARDKR